MRKYRTWFLFAVLLVKPSVSTASDPPEDLFIIFTANLNAMLQNCQCGQEPLGGLDRIKTYVDSFRTEHPSSILLDGGDFLNSYPFPELNAAMLRALNLLRYDIMVPGEHEILEGLQFFDRAEIFPSARILGGNLSWPSERDIRSSVVWSDRLQFTAFVQRGCLEPVIQGAASVLQIRDEIPGAKQQRDFCRVMVFHGYRSELTRQLDTGACADLILLAHDQFSGVEYFSGLPVVGVGKDGEQIAVIRISDGLIADISHISITENIQPDPSINGISKMLDQQLGRN